MSPPFLPRLLDFWKQQDFDPTDRSFLLAISGGADSVALLELFAREVAPRWNCRLFAAHVDHGLRAESGGDRAAVEALCREHGVPLAVEVLDPASRAIGQSLEMWGREQRYAAFARASERFGGAMVPLTAHHRDDVVETFCLRLWRGTGLAGLAGIPFRRHDGTVRPLLPVGRAELRAWLTGLGTPWREDASNADESIPRNWVRHHLLPAWRREDAEVDARVFAMARSIADLLPAWRRWAAEEHPPQIVLDRGGIPAEWVRGAESSIDASILKGLLPALGLTRPPPELLSEIFRQASGGSREIRVRVDEATVLTEKDGVLVLARSVSERRKSP